LHYGGRPGRHEGARVDRLHRGTGGPGSRPGGKVYPRTRGSQQDVCRSASDRLHRGTGKPEKSDRSAGPPPTLVGDKYREIGPVCRSASDFSRRQVLRNRPAPLISHEKPREPPPTCITGVGPVGMKGPGSTASTGGPGDREADQAGRSIPGLGGPSRMSAGPPPTASTGGPGSRRNRTGLPVRLRL
jgi:hypothetical protein